MQILGRRIVRSLRMVSSPNIDNIFAQATVEVWKERLRDGECTLKEFNDALTDSLDRVRNKDSHNVQEASK